MPKRKRKRTRLKALPFLVLGLIASLVAGVFYSPLTAVSKVTVTGARPEDQPQIDAALKALNRIPVIMVNRRWVETRVQRIGAVDRAEYSQNIFGRGHLTVTYRNTIAKVSGPTPLGMDTQGVVYKLATLPPNLPQVARQTEATILTITGSWPSGRIAQLAQKVRQMEPNAQLKIWFNSEGALCLNIDDGRVILGACEDLDNKLKALADFQTANPGLLAQLDNLNLTAPSTPAKTYKKQRR